MERELKVCPVCRRETGCAIVGDRSKEQHSHQCSACGCLWHELERRPLPAEQTGGNARLLTYKRIWEAANRERNYYRYEWLKMLVETGKDIDEDNFAGIKEEIASMEAKHRRNYPPAPPVVDDKTEKEGT